MQEQFYSDFILGSSEQVYWAISSRDTSGYAWSATIIETRAQFDELRVSKIIAIDRDELLL